MTKGWLLPTFLAISVANFSKKVLNATGFPASSLLAVEKSMMINPVVRNSPISNQSLLDGMVQSLSLLDGMVQGPLLRVSGVMCELLAPESGWGLELLGEGEGNEDTADHHGDLGPDEQEFSSCNV